MKKKITSILRIAWPMVPAAFGIFGLLKTGENFLDAAYTTAQMFLFSYGLDYKNIYIEIARWLAPLVTASGVILLTNRLSKYITNAFSYIRGDSVAVYGGENINLAKDLLEQLGKRGIDCSDQFVKAHRYIIVGSEAENFSFLERYKKQLTNTIVYCKTSNLPAQSIATPTIQLFSAEEITARLFWREIFPYEAIMTQKKPYNIVIIGFEAMGQDLFSWGIQTLIFHKNQQVTYHIFGDNSGYKVRHPHLDAIHDQSIFYKNEWYDNLSLIEEADLVLVTRETDQISLLQQILACTTRNSIYAFTSSTNYMYLIENLTRVIIVNKDKYISNPQNILQDNLLACANHYAHLYTKVEETKENSWKEWQSLNAFTRYSFISQTDYHEIRLRILALRKIPLNTDLWSDELMEEMAELEHIRWNRFHYINNWQYGIPKSARIKDSEKRIHRCLVPYDQLPDNDKEKERENIRILLSVQSELT